MSRRSKKRRAVQPWIQGLRLVALVVILLAWVYNQRHEQPASGPLPRSASQGRIEAAFENQTSNLMVTATGRLVKVLSDDSQGSRHQRFLVELPSGLSVLIAHNIDLAPRVPDLKKGESITIHGEYEWNEKGGVIHWTHHDPRGHHEDGWVEYRGRRYG
jgi:hypothetical protein